MDATTSMLRRCEIFSGLSDTDLNLIARASRRREVPEGTSLFKQGEPRTGATIIAEGRVEITRDNGSGPEPVVILGPGDIAGEQSFLAVSAHTATGTTLTPAVLLELDRHAVLESLSQDGAAAIAVLSKVASVLHQRLLYGANPRTGREQAYASGRVRMEADLLGSMEVPEDALFGIQTLRAVHNFPITGTPTSHFPTLIRALAMVKQGAARANARLGLMDAKIAMAIDRACQEIIDGHWHGHFPTDMVQGGAGTSTNMNANEVIANRALELLGFKRGDYVHCHPNDHVNLGQSTNDVYPTALRLMTIFSLRTLLEAMEGLKAALHAKGQEFSDVIKMGRTQLQDAVPMTLGQEFEAFAVTTGEDIERLQETARLFLEVNMGATAIGTGICADPRYPVAVVEDLRTITGLDLKLSPNLVEATPDTGAFVMFSGVVKRAAVKLSKMCNDLRLLSSGPRCGFGEINLPPMQPGSSIMPGKVNPVIPEVVNQVAYQVIGNDLTITLAAEAGQLQLNVMEPILAYSLATSLHTLTAAVKVLTSKCIVGITANRERCLDLVEHSIGIVTAVMPAIGYKKATEVAKEALATGRPVREIILQKGYLTPAEVDEAFSLEAMTQPRPLR
ncbi:MAG TPA: aspartate ammonia-lyase [Geothrix sp.]|nr:aspartate ammonia-lyase [Geothrix sp.]